MVSLQYSAVTNNVLPHSLAPRKFVPLVTREQKLELVEPGGESNNLRSSQVGHPFVAR